MHKLFFACRRFRRHPAFPFLATVTLALAIGATTLAFAITDSVRTQVVPLVRPDRVVWIGETNGSDETGTSFPEIARLGQATRSFLAVSAITHLSVRYTGADGTAAVPAAEISVPFFRVVAVSPMLGRAFVAEDDHANSAPVVIIGDTFWRTRLKQRRDVIGTPLMVDGRSRTIVGVMPPGFQFPGGQTQLWIPAVQDFGPYATTENVHIMGAIARLAPGATLVDAATEVRHLTSVHDVVAGDSRDTYRPFVRLLTDEWTRDIEPRLHVLIGIGLAMLILGSANVASMLVTQAIHRRGELTLRQALGAKGRDVLGLISAEVMLLLVAGVMSGLLFARTVIAMTPRDVAATLPELRHVSVTLRAVGFSAIIATVISIVLGVITYRQFSIPSIADALKPVGVMATSSRFSRRTRSGLIVVEIAMTLVMLSGAAVLAKAYLSLSGNDIGYQPQGVYAADLARPHVILTPVERPDILSFAAAALSSLERTPGLAAVAITTQAPGTGNDMISTASAERGTDSIDVGVDAVSRDYFRVLGMRIDAGRAFTSQEDQAGEAVAIVDAGLARRLFRGRSAVGEVVLLHNLAMRLRIVGVVANIRQGEAAQPGLRQAYIPYRALPLPWITVLLRSRLPTGDAKSALAISVKRVDPDQPIEHFSTLTDRLRSQLDRSRFYASLLTSLAFASVILTGLGLYGTMSLVVAQRTSEIGVRLALGAKPIHIFEMVLREALVAVLAGVVIGLGLIFVFGRVLTALLYGVSPLDARMQAAGVLAIVIVAAAASIVPAVRASLIPPSDALRRV